MKYSDTAQAGGTGVEADDRLTNLQALVHVGVGSGEEW